MKKVQVEKHVAACPHCECLSCIDCGKDFWGDDYKSHVKCISEDQKYGGKGYEGKTHKGDAKQQAWLQKINELIKRPNVSPKVRDLLLQISGFDNIPRKKAKFQNWMKNSLKIYNESLLEQVWAVFSEASSGDQDPASNKGPQQPAQAPGTKAQAETPKAPAPKAREATDTQEKQTAVKKSKRERKEERQKNRKKEKKELKLESQQEGGKNQKAPKRKAGREEGGEDGGETQALGRKRQRKKSQSEQAQDAGAGAGAGTRNGPRKRKRKDSQAEAESQKRKSPGAAENGEAENQEETSAKGKFNWKGTIKAILRQAPENEIAVKRLRKKVLAQYYAVTSEHHKTEEELLVIFNRKISKNPSFRLLKDKVTLLK